MKRFKSLKAGCIGPAMVISGVMAFVTGLICSFVVSILTLEPGQQISSSKGSTFWNLVAMAGLWLVGAGLFVMLFQSVLFLVRKAGVAQDKESQ